MRKGSKVAKHCVFPMSCGSRGSKSRLAKQRVRSHVAKWEMKSGTPLWREAHFQVKMHKTHHARTTFGTWDVGKCTPLCWKHVSKSKVLKTDGLRALLEVFGVETVYVAMAGSTFPSQNVQSTSASDYFWKLRYRKNARCCGAKRMSKSKV